MYLGLWGRVLRCDMLIPLDVMLERKIRHSFPQTASTLVMARYLQSGVECVEVALSGF